MASTSFEIDSEFLTKKLPPRRRTSHKGMNGVVCVVGGSRTFHGAPFLCAMGAAKTGADLVYLAVRQRAAVEQQASVADDADDRYAMAYLDARGGGEILRRTGRFYHRCRDAAHC